MKRFLALVLLLAVALCASGCATLATDTRAPIQQVLDAVLPADFTGDAAFTHKNPYADVTISAGNLRKVDGRWQWDWLRYHRNGRVSYGEITLGTPPAR